MTTTVVFDLDAFERRMAHKHAIEPSDVELLIEVLRSERAARSAVEQERDARGRALGALTMRAETLMRERDGLQNAYDTLFVTHQREMDRLHKERDQLNELCEALAAQNTFFQEASAALGQMTVEEVSATQARITNALIPQLAKLMLVSMIKGVESGELYNYIEWDMGEFPDLPEVGYLTLALQRGNGKTPAVLIAEAQAERDQARAEAATLNEQMLYQRG